MLTSRNVLFHNRDVTLTVTLCCRSNVPRGQLNVKHLALPESQSWKQQRQDAVTVTENDLQTIMPPLGYLFIYLKYGWFIMILFLALLDYVSRAHGIAICPSSVVRRPSVRPSVRLSVSQLSLNLMHGFLSNFSFGFPWAIRSDVF